MSTLVLTSLNPLTNMDSQLNCFNEWAKVGYEIRSYNSSMEYEALLKLGLQSGQLNEIRIEDTAGQLFGKPVPRILPLLENAVLTGHDYYILTNADIFPAHRKVISACLAKSFQAAAFTRTECLDLALNKFQSQAYYQGGLDLFWFTKPGLHKLLEKLRLSPVAERMTFGVPGWDYFLGHVLCATLDSPIMDGSIFIHQSHKTTYGRIDEFAHYAAVMINSGRYTNREPAALAHEFSSFISNKCEDNNPTARFLKLAFYKQPDTPPSMNSAPRNNNQVILRQFSEQLDDAQVASVFSDVELEVFTEKQNEGGGWAAAISMVRNQGRQVSYRLYSLQLLLLALLCRQQKNTSALTLKYPQGNLHAVALKQITRNEAGPKQERHIFNLFASELVDYGIVNPNLMKYLFTAATNSDEKALFFNVISICKQGLRYA